MKGIYRANAATQRFISSDVVADDYVLQANETFENPTGKLEPAKLVGTSWQDATQEEHEAWIKAQQAELPNIPTEPSADSQAMNALGLQVAVLTKQNQQMRESINKLGLQVAQSMKEENGGN
ncbi:hypothetical protein [Limosilactobacillus reuteri]|uniref:hypothetical protein n=1 Tax=Limosilactobacillus reuteri TaxID=1598 RepID=UPI002B05781D|nr:hypothetical protein [Limosilactobacillus reuteri]